MKDGLSRTWYVVMAAALGWAIAAGASLDAHVLSTSTSRVSVDGSEVHVAFTLNLTDLHAGPDVDANGDGYVSVDELDRGIDRLYAAVKENYRVSSATAPLAVRLDRYQFVDDNVVEFDLSYSFAAPVRSVTVTSTLSRITQSDHRHLVRVTIGGTTREGVLDLSGASMTFDDAGAAVSMRTTAVRFVKLGIEHIFTGYDHLAFLLGLLVCATSLGAIVKVVSSFTVAHSITLALATFGLVALPSRVIESLIALSIAYIATENLLLEHAEGRWRVTFLFGLVHGFGFSNVLRDMHLPRQALAASLFTFNAGVEIGQIAFVLIVFPTLAWLAATQWKQRMVPLLSAVILCLGVYWFVERAFLT